MKFPCEIIVWEVLPSIRAAIAEELIKRGLSQREVSKIFGITQAAISQYTSKKRGSRINFRQDAKEEIKKLADDIVHGYMDNHTNLTARICGICMKIRADGTVCGLSMNVDSE